LIRLEVIMTLKYRSMSQTLLRQNQLYVQGASTHTKIVTIFRNAWMFCTKFFPLV